MYGPSSYRHGDQFWRELSGLYGLSSECWCIGGDSNVVRWVNEKNLDIRSTTSMNTFNGLIEEMDIVDILL